MVDQRVALPGVRGYCRSSTAAPPSPLQNVFEPENCPPTGELCGRVRPWSRGSSRAVPFPAGRSASRGCAGRRRAPRAWTSGRHQRAPAGPHRLRGGAPKVRRGSARTTASPSCSRTGRRTSRGRSSRSPAEPPRAAQPGVHASGARVLPRRSRCRALVVGAGATRPRGLAAERGARCSSCADGDGAPSGRSRRPATSAPRPRRRRARAAHVRDDGAAEARAADARNLCASARNIAADAGARRRDRCLNVMPLFHIHGLVGGAARVARAPAASVGLHARLPRAAVPRLARRARADVVHGRADDAPGRARARPSATGAARAPPAALRPLVVGARCRRRVLDGLEEAFGVPGDRGVRHDRGRASDGEQPAPARRRGSRARSGRPPGPRSRSSTRTGRAVPARARSARS